jgi:phosphoribosylamine--glycine ligase
MNILVIGSGAREHALCWKLAREGGVRRVVCAPGNAGIASVADCAAVDPADPASILEIVDRESIDFTVVGPELPLTRGVVDLLVSTGHPVCGPTRAAAELESSKAFAKDFMARHSVPTAAHRVCLTAEDAFACVRGGRFGFPVVIKADGLAAGKGVTVAPDLAAAEAAIRDIMLDRKFGDAGARLVVEECLVGREASFFVLTDGEDAVVLPSAEDHKRAFDGDRGPNTGGMGAFSPSPLVDGPMSDRIIAEIVDPVLSGMRSEGRPYRGFLYVGLMMTADGPRVIEFNARLGDPETQVILPRIDQDLVPLLVDAARGALGQARVRQSARAHVGVVLASGGYPDRFEAGKVITGVDAASGLPGVALFHAATSRRGDDLVTSGGRVLTVTAGGADIAHARTAAYEAVGAIRFEGMHYRRDIGVKALGGVLQAEG